MTTQATAPAPPHPDLPATPGLDRAPAPVARQARRRLDPRRLPPWAQALLVFAGSRLLVSYVAYRAATLAGRRGDGHVWTYWDIANNWDGTWYQRIAVEGYPAHLPRDHAGAVAPNTWAFYPLFPRLAGTLAELTGLPWTPAATIVSVLAGIGAVLVMRSLLARVAGPRLALWGVALFSVFPASAVLQLPYAESLALLLLVTVFWALQRGRYVLAVPALLMLGVARPVAVPMAVVVTVHLALHLRRDRSPRAAVGPVLAWLAAGVAAIEWPLIAWSGTGVRDAYPLTMASWRSPHELVPLRPWWMAGQLFLGHLIGPVVLVLGVGGLFWWLARPRARVIGTDLRVWCAAYICYLLAVLDSFTSLPRYLLPLFPLGVLLAAVSPSRAYRLALTTGFAVLGVLWMLVIWRSRVWAP